MYRYVMLVAWFALVFGLFVALRMRPYDENLGFFAGFGRGMTAGAIVIFSSLYSYTAEVHLTQSLIYLFIAYFTLCLECKKSFTGWSHLFLFVAVSFLFVAGVSECFGMCYYDANPGIIYENNYKDVTPFLLAARDIYGVSDAVILRALYVTIGFTAFFPSEIVYLPSDTYSTQCVVRWILSATLGSWFADLIKVMIVPSVANKRDKMPPE